MPLHRARPRTAVDATDSLCLPNRASGAFLHRVRAGTIRSKLDGQVTGSADRGVAALPPLSPARRSWRIVRCLGLEGHNTAQTLPFLSPKEQATLPRPTRSSRTIFVRRRRTCLLYTSDAADE